LALPGLLIMYATRTMVDLEPPFFTHPVRTGRLL